MNQTLKTDLGLGQQELCGWAVTAAPWVFLLVHSEPAWYSARRVVRGWDFLEPFLAHPGAVHVKALLAPTSHPPSQKPGSSVQMQRTSGKHVPGAPPPVLLFLVVHTVNGHNYPLSSSDNYSK